MTSFSRIIIIYNPASTGGSADAAEFLMRQLKSIVDVPIQTVATKHAGHAEQLAYEYCLRYKNPLVISSSGDGGYNETVNGVMRAQREGARPVCAVLPAGNANDHRNAIAEGPLIHAIRTGKIAKLDILEVSLGTEKQKKVRFGHSYVGLGLTPAIAVELNRHSINAFKEILILLRGFYQFRPVEIEIQGKKLAVDSLIVTNIGRMAKVLSFEASAPDDGIFEVTIFPHDSKLRLFGRLLRALFQGLPPDSRHKRYSLITLKKMPIQIDGEVLEIAAGEVVSIEIKKHALRTIL